MLNLVPKTFHLVSKKIEISAAEIKSSDEKNKIRAEEIKSSARKNKS